jgi:4-amino-4-deoxy-L-arabinose transferase-like glycosyltransferase
MNDTPPSGRQVAGDLLGAAAAWCVLLTISLLVRPPFPIDETRYLSVAWEMWSRGDLLVPHLLGEPYHHKPPLLFWGMHLGWWLFGVSEWWARLVAPAFALVTLLMSTLTARALWPDRPEVARLVPWLLVGALFWSLFATLTMFDLLVAACTLTAAYGLVLAALHGRWWGHVICAAAISVGILAKGPVVLLHALPLMLAAPWWARLPRSRWWRWYAASTAALVVGIALALAWVLPAASRGGEAYADAILWHQSAARISGVDDGRLNAHQHPWWWYLPFLPVLLFPWALWPPAWRALAHVRAHLTEPGVRWGLCWCISVLILHSAIGGKQVHYLIPLIAPAVLVLARLLTTGPMTTTRLGQVPLAALYGLIALVLLIAPALDADLLRRLGTHEAAPQTWLAAIGPWPAVVLLLIAVWTLAVRTSPVAARVRSMALAGLLLLTGLLTTLAPVVSPAYDLRPLSRRIAGWQAAGVTVARVGSYRAEYQFLGRLTQPPQRIFDADIRGWARHHTNGVVLRTYGAKNPLPAWMPPPDEDLPHRGVRLGLWRSATLNAVP